ncbi:hypothetical protein CN947_17160 [Bacillus cereus]|nr:hypothetical protein CN947_17160 [Bacillus cereus]
MRRIFLKNKVKKKHRYSMLFLLPRYLWIVRLPPQNLANARKLGGSRATDWCGLIISGGWTKPH